MRDAVEISMGLGLLPGCKCAAPAGNTRQSGDVWTSNNSERGGTRIMGAMALLGASVAGTVLPHCLPALASITFG